MAGGQEQSVEQARKRRTVAIALEAEHQLSIVLGRHAGMSSMAATTRDIVIRVRKPPVGPRSGECAAGAELVDLLP